MMYLELFWSFFKIGLFSIGGGYSAVPLIQKVIIDQKAWLTMQEFSDIMVIAEMTPGPIVINAATFVGTKMCGVLGAIICTLGAITPSFIIVLSLYFIYKKFRQLAVVQGTINGLKPAVVALITSAGLSLLFLATLNGEFNWTNFDFVGLGIFAISFIVLRIWKINPIIMMAIMGLLGTGIYYLIL